MDLRKRIQALAKRKLMNIKIEEEMKVLIEKFGAPEIEHEIAKAGLSYVLMETFYRVFDEV